MAQAKDNTSAQLTPGAEGGSLPAIALRAGAPVTVGRADDVEITIADSSLSRRHATIWHQDGEWWIRDEGSLNGTWVNGERVEGTQLLDGDGVDFGGNAAYRFSVIKDTGEKRAERHDRTVYSSPAFCLALVPEDGGKQFLLRRKLSIVGRNRTADLQLDDPSVSGVHAKIEYQRGRVTLHDSGSRNGTVVNGEPVRRLNLVPGDRVAFGGVHFAVRRTWLPSAMALSGAIAGVLAAIAITLVPLVMNTSSSQAEPLWTRDMYLAQVSESLRLAVEACDSDPRRTEVAEAQFAIAKRSLIGADEMRPDRQTDEDLARALRKSAGQDRLQKMLHGRDLYELYRSLSEPVAADEPQKRPEPAGEFDLDRELSRMVAQFGIDTRQRPIPKQMRDEVERYIEFWTVEKRGFTERAYKRGAPHLDMIRSELRAAQLPEVFCYLPFIESGYRTDVTSSAKARGLWQFMPSTGRAHGLRVDDQIDERIDPQKATRAACSYINSLLNMFGPNAFLCAVAAYNKGENGMARCLKKNANWRSTWKFWDVASAGDGCLKQETIEYVPRFLAAAVVLRRPEVFGLTTD